MRPQPSSGASSHANKARLLSTLTPAQREAVEHLEGPQLILAGPGSGKTRVVTHRIANMLEEGIPDTSILALTFTNKAADEMRARLDQLSPGHNVWMGTFHRWCAQQLRRYAPLVGLKENYSIYDSEDSLKLLREAINDSDCDLVHVTPGRIANSIGWAKNDLITAEEYRSATGNPLGSLVERIYPHYQRRLLSANAVDFDDLLLLMALLLRNNSELRASLDSSFRYIMVDEYQDTNLAQYAIVRALSVDYPNLSVTGDPDQSIYGWRGATIRNILEFERDFDEVQVVRLEENFRSTQAILRAADQLIANNVNRKVKTLRTDNPEGKPVRIVVHTTARREADAIAARIANEVAAQQRRYRDYAIFYRTNALSRTLERSMRAISVPYQIVRGLEFYQRREVKDILAYLQLLNNPANDIAFLRIVNTPPRRIGKTTINRLADYARENGLPLFEAARRAGLIPSLSKRTAVNIAKFVALIDSMQLTGDEKVEQVMGRVFQHTGYRDWLDANTSEEELQRAANLDELLSDAREFDELHPDDGGLEAFLEQASLVADVDDWEVETDCVTMMTLHAAKGLEFPVVFIVGLEDDLLPHQRSKEDPDQLEEERRLLFVGMTRAMEELHLNAAQQRTISGNVDLRASSPFLMELPREEMEVFGQLGYQRFGVDDYVPDDDWSFDETEGGTELAFADDAEFDEELQQRVRDQLEGTHQGEAGSEQEAPGSSPSPFMTAAEMAGAKASGPAVAPEQFRLGMVVLHPEYGIGRIVSLGGSGTKRTAQVRFSDEIGPKSFRLAFAPLRPVGKSSE